MGLAILFEEVCVLIFYITLSLQFISNTNTGATRDSTCITIMMINVGLHVFFNAVGTGASIYKWLKGRVYKKNNAVTPIDLDTRADGEKSSSQGKTDLRV